MKIAKNIIAVMLVVVIIIGIYITINKGINVGLLYKEREQIEISLNKQFETQDVKKVLDEVFENKDYLIKKASNFQDSLIIQSEDITDEHIQKITEKLNEKYTLNTKSEDITVEKIGAIDLKSDLQKYILPSVITLVLIAIYFAIRFKKLGMIRTVVRFLTTVIFAELLYVSVVSITQIEIGRLLAPLGFMLYMLVVLASTVVFEKERKELVSQENK